MASDSSFPSESERSEACPSIVVVFVGNDTSSEMVIIIWMVWSAGSERRTKPMETGFSAAEEQNREADGSPVLAQRQ